MDTVLDALMASETITTTQANGSVCLYLRADKDMPDLRRVLLYCFSCNRSFSGMFISLSRL